MKFIRNALFALIVLVTLQSTWYFLGMQRASFLTWICFNACAVANVTFIVGFILSIPLKTRVIMYMATLPLFFFGTGGLIVFPWKGMNIIPQISHIIMTLNLLVMFWEMFKSHDYKNASIGLLLSIIVFSFFIAFQQNYVFQHPEEWAKLMVIK